MSKISSIHLFNLIKSLSGPEKRYFRLSVEKLKTETTPIYLRLFDVIDSQEQFNDAEIIKTLPGIKPTQLSNIKNYLYHSVLEILRGYHIHSRAEIKIRAGLDKVEILNRKNLHAQSYDLIKKLKKYISKKRLELQLPEILLWELKLSASREFMDKKLIRVNRVENQIEAAVKMFRARAELTQLFIKINRLYQRTGTLVNGETARQLNNIMNHSVLKNEKELWSYESKYLFFNIHSLFYIMNSDWEKQYIFQKKTLRLIETYSRENKRLSSGYLSQVNSMLISCAKTKKYAEMLSTFEKVRSLLKDKKTKVGKESQVMLVSCYNSLLYHYTQRGEFESALPLYKEFMPIVIKTQNHFHKGLAMSFRFNMAYLFFQVKNYQQCLAWLNKVLNESPAVDTRSDIQAFARIFNLVVHYELGNTDLLEHRIKSMARSKRAEQKIPDKEMLLIDFFKKNINSHDKKSLRNSFIELKESLYVIEKKQNQNDQSYFDLAAWVESKIENKNFATILKRKLNC